MEAGQEMLLAEVLSPSQVSQFLNCPAKWMFRYLLDLKEPGTAATALGRAFHETIAHNFRQKAETAHDLPVAECLDCFRKVLVAHVHGLLHFIDTAIRPEVRTANTGCR